MFWGGYLKPNENRLKKKKNLQFSRSVHTVPCTISSDKKKMWKCIDIWEVQPDAYASISLRNPHRGESSNFFYYMLDSHSLLILINILVFSFPWPRLMQVWSSSSIQIQRGEVIFYAIAMFSWLSPLGYLPCYASESFIFTPKNCVSTQASILSKLHQWYCFCCWSSVCTKCTDFMTSTCRNPKFSL